MRDRNTVPLRQLAANRRNAQRSTGPRTAAAKARTARNALRHGLAIPLIRDPIRSALIEPLAMALVGQSARPDRLEQARVAAQAELELRRVRAYRKALLDRKAAELAAHRPKDDDPEHPQAVALNSRCEAAAVAAVLAELAALERYERCARARRRRAMRWLAYTSILEDS